MNYKRFAGGCWSEAMVARCVTHLCGQCADYLYAQMCRASGCSVSTFPLVVGKFISRSTETGPPTEK